MKPIHVAGLVVLVLLTFTGVAFGVWRIPAPVRQPMAFNHRLHMEKEEMECTDCHKYVKRLPQATTPLVKDCMKCHFEAEGKDPDEPKIRELSEKKEEIPWIQVNHLPGHVYFSHRAHVRFARMKCQECHGKVEKLEKPVSLPSIGHLTMGRCVDCHQKKKASIDCIICHK